MEQHRVSYLIAAIDESLRPGVYLMCATVASTNDRVHIGHSLRSLLLPNQRRLHAKTESLGRKTTLLKAIAAIPGISCHVAVGPPGAIEGRRQCLLHLAPHLAQLNAKEILLERTDLATAAADRKFMTAFCSTSANLTWRHEEPAHEPLLWISDLVLSAYGAGGALRQIAEPVITKVIAAK